MSSIDQTIENTIKTESTNEILKQQIWGTIGKEEQNRLINSALLYDLGLYDGPILRTNPVEIIPSNIWKEVCSKQEEINKFNILDQDLDKLMRENKQEQEQEDPLKFLEIVSDKIKKYMENNLELNPTTDKTKKEQKSKSSCTFIDHNTTTTKKQKTSSSTTMKTQMI